MSDIKLQDAAREYLEYLKSEGKSERTLYTYRKDLDQIEAYFKPEKKLAAIMVPHVSGFLKSDALLKLPSGKERSEPTVKKTVRVFRMFLVWSLGKGYITKLPLPKDMPMGRSVKATTEGQDDSGSAD
ncbi:MAG: site-specific integrase [Candidatus Marsarchaeota archaeon]|nr:site-specific integrase [Candidatus Marsarchaeota archaeon]